MVDMKHFDEALKLVRPSCLRSSLGRTELSTVLWEHIGGLDEIKIKLRQVAINEWPGGLITQLERQRVVMIYHLKTFILSPHVIVCLH